MSSNKKKKKFGDTLYESKRSQQSEDGSDIESTQKPAFEIRSHGSVYDPSQPPKDGHDFLLQMAHERRKCSAIVVCNPPKKIADGGILNHEKDGTVGETNPMPAIAETLLPSKEWKDCQVENFQKMRQLIDELREQSLESRLNKNISLPANTDSDAWIDFCQRNPPTLGIVMRFCQQTLENILEILAESLDATKNELPDQERSFATAPNSTNEPTWSPGASASVISAASSSSAAANARPGEAAAIFDLSCSEEWVGQWLYATLACLHLPLEPEVHSTLRDIARHCIRLRNRLQAQEVEKALPYNLFIILISRVFQQFDLSEFV